MSLFKQGLIATLAWLLMFASMPLRAAEGGLAVRFGILRQAGDDFVLAEETRRIPRHLHDTGFRFGVAIDNPSQAKIHWYEVIRLPAEPAETSGTLHQVALQVLQTDEKESDQSVVVDDFWFDAGDPLGRHRLELFVDGQLAYSVDFEVIEP